MRKNKNCTVRALQRIFLLPSLLMVNQTKLGITYATIAVQNGLQLKEIDKCCNLTELEKKLDSSDY